MLDTPKVPSPLIENVSALSPWLVIGVPANMILVINTSANKVKSIAFM
jgi:hypothetical protein